MPMNTIVKHLSQVSEGMMLLDQTEIQTVVHVLSAVRKLRGTVYLFGNGGSHATASHFANDLNKMARVKAMCVGDGIATMTAYGNDEGWANMFSAHLSKILTANDCVVGISCSGLSENVIRGLEIGKGICLAVGLTGLGNDTWINKIGLDALVHARVPDIPVQEDLHSFGCHAGVRSLQEG